MRFEFETLAQMLQHRAQEKPEERAYTYLIDGEQEEASVTYGALDQQAKAIAAHLQARGLSGQRVMLLFVPGLEFVSAFYGCLYAGAIAVPAYPPDPMRLSRTLPRLQAVAKDAAPALVLTTAPLLEMAEFIFSQAPDLAALRWTTIEEASAGPLDSWRAPTSSQKDLAFLQYTSGSTSLPKGVMVSHQNVLANLAMMRHAGRQSEETTIGVWLPFYHDLGLIGGILLPPFLGSRSVLMSPIDFLKKPSRWLWMIHRHKVKASAAPNFALDLCVQKIPLHEKEGLSLSHWEMALIGAEPLRESTLARFIEDLAPYGFRPEAIVQGYGMAETVLSASAGSIDERYTVRYSDASSLALGRYLAAPKEDKNARPIVSCGRPLLEQRIEIVDPETQTICEEGRIGEVWIAGPNVTLGYWQRPSESEQSFGASLANTSGPAFLRSGDLGFILNGELFITGRKKDLIIIRGKNHYPQDIEISVERCHKQVRPGCVAAFSLEEGNEEALGVALEVDTRKGPPDFEELVASIQAVIAGEHDLSVRELLFLEPGAIPKTSSGKLQRHACKTSLLEDASVLLYRWRSSSTQEVAKESTTITIAEQLQKAPPTERQALVEEFVVRQLAEVTKLEASRLRPSTPLASLGLDSLMSLEVKRRLEEGLGLPLSASVLWEQKSIRELVGALLQESEGSSPRRAQDKPQEAKGGSRESHFASLIQEGMWRDYRWLPAGYVQQMTLRFEGDLHEVPLRRALQQLVARNPLLRATFHLKEEGLTIREHANTLPEVRWLSINSEDQLEAFLKEDATTAFDLQEGLPFRFAVLRLHAKEHILCASWHHIIGDATAYDIIPRELISLYSHELGLSPAPNPPEGDFSQYAAAERSERGSPSYERSRQYWMQKLEGSPLHIQVGKRGNPQDPSQWQMRSAELFFDSELTEQLTRLAREQGVTLYALLLSALLLVFRRRFQQDDLAVCTSVSRRDDPTLLRVVGPLFNHIVLRAELSRVETFDALLAQVQKTILEGMEHRSFPFLDVLDALCPKREERQQPCFGLNVNVHYYALSQIFSSADMMSSGVTLGDIKVSNIPLGERPTIRPWDLSLGIFNLHEAALRFSLRYNDRLFSAESAMSLLKDTQQLLSRMLEAPTRRLIDC